MIDRACAKENSFDYHRRVDVYIVQKANPSAQMTSYLGTKVIVLEGMLIADLLADQRPQLTSLLARFLAIRYFATFPSFSAREQVGELRPLVGEQIGDEHALEHDDLVPR